MCSVLVMAATIAATVFHLKSSPILHVSIPYELLTQSEIDVN